MKARDIMDKRTSWVKEEDSLKMVCQVLIKNQLSGVPVVNKKNELVGFISERDIILSIAKHGRLESRVKEAMVRKVVSVKEEAQDVQISRIFLRYPFKYVPVVRGKKIVGIISRKNVIDKLLGYYY